MSMHSCCRSVAASLALFLALSSTDNELKLWSVENGTCLRTFRGHTNEKNFVGLTVDASFIACGKPHLSPAFLVKKELFAKPGSLIHSVRLSNVNWNTFNMLMHIV